MTKSNSSVGPIKIVWANERSIFHCHLLFYNLCFVKLLFLSRPLSIPAQILLRNTDLTFLSSHGSMPKVMDDINSDEDEVDISKKKVN